MDSPVVGPEPLQCPFGRLDTLSLSELRDTAYELFFMSCRSSPGFGGTGRSASGLGPQPEGNGGESGSPLANAGAGKGGVGMTVVSSKLKKALGLKSRRSSPLRKVSQAAAGPNLAAKVKRPMTSAEIMRQQMRVTDHSDNRLRKTLMRTLVGQTGRKAETIILPLELLRQIKPSEFSDLQEYHQWQRRQLKTLEAGLLLFPSLTIERRNPAVKSFREVLRASEAKPIDTNKNSEAMRHLCDSVVALAWRDEASPDMCHWADGYPVNVLLYIALLQSIFDLKEETVVLDEVDELIELMKKTWPSLGLNKRMHNLCLTWLFFNQYVATGQIDHDLLGAATAMLAEVANDAKNLDFDDQYRNTLRNLSTFLLGWADKRLVDYHESFKDVAGAKLEYVVSLAIAAHKITEEIFSSNDSTTDVSSSTNRVDYYIKSSMRNAFSKILENGAANKEDEVTTTETDEDPSETLVRVSKATEELAIVEKEKFSPVMKKWHSAATAAAVVTIHNRFHLVLRQYLAKVTGLTNELVKVLQAAGKLEKILVQMVAEDSEEHAEGAKGIVKEMVPYEVEGLFSSLLKTWIEERLSLGEECLSRAKDTENWMPKSKTEPFAESAVDLIRLTKLTMDEFYEIQVGSRDDMLQELATGFVDIFQDYTAFIASCGSKQNYIPTLPPLTRCNRRSHFIKLWQMTMPQCSCSPTIPTPNTTSNYPENPRPSTSRTTQHLYIRLNTLHYILAHLQALDKSLSFFTRTTSPRGVSVASSFLFEPSRASVQAAVDRVSEVAAYRLVFFDSYHALYDSLYVNNVSSSRIRPALQLLKQNITLLASILIDRAQAQLVREVMKASFEAFLMVLLAGGPNRSFFLSDYEMIAEDFKGLKKVFYGEGLLGEEIVEKEAEVAEGVLALMGMKTERLIEEFSIAVSEGSGLGGTTGSKVLMPPTTGRWSRRDANTVLRVLCYRDDEEANGFLKNNFQLAKRR